MNSPSAPHFSFLSVHSSPLQMYYCLGDLLWLLNNTSSFSLRLRFLHQFQASANLSLRKDMLAWNTTNNNIIQYRLYICWLKMQYTGTLEGLCIIIITQREPNWTPRWENDFILNMCVWSMWSPASSDWWDPTSVNCLSALHIRIIVHLFLQTSFSSGMLSSAFL